MVPSLLIASSLAWRPSQLALHRPRRAASLLMNAIPDEVAWVYNAYGGLSDTEGGLEAAQLRGALRELDCELDSPAATQLLRKYDVDRNSLIDLSELSTLVASLAPAEVWEAFRASDPTDLGYLDIEATRSALRLLDCDIDSPTAARLLREYDINENGRLELLGFASLVADLAPVAVWEAFRSQDAAGGSLDANQLRLALLKLDYDIDSPTTAQLLRRYDANKNARLELTEFAKLVSKLAPRKVADAYANHVDGSDGLDLTQLRAALSTLQIAVDSEDAQRLLTQYDADRNSRVSLLGFASIVSHLQRQRAWWRRWR